MIVLSGIHNQSPYLSYLQRMVKHRNNATVVVDFTYTPIILDTYLHQIYLLKSRQILTTDIYRVKDFFWVRKSRIVYSMHLMMSKKIQFKVPPGTEPGFYHSGEKNLY